MSNPTGKGGFQERPEQINREGRPEGAKDKKWQSIQSCWNEFIELCPTLTNSEKARYWFRMVELHFERAVALIPKTPEGSVANANEIFEKKVNATSPINRGAREPNSVG